RLDRWALAGHGRRREGRCWGGRGRRLGLGRADPRPGAADPGVCRRGAGAAAGEGLAENLVVVLGHAEYYPRFGFRPASQFGVTAPFDVPDEAFMALALDSELPTPRGEIVYPSAFGV